MRTVTFQEADRSERILIWNRNCQASSELERIEPGGGLGDLFTSVIHACELNHANPFDYLTELQKHAGGLAKNPAAWLPWNYRQSLPQAGTSKHPA